MTSAAAVAYRLANVGRKGAVRVINCSFRLCPSMQRAIIAARDIFARGSLYGLAEESPRERGSQYASKLRTELETPAKKRRKLRARPI